MTKEELMAMGVPEDKAQALAEKLATEYVPKSQMEELSKELTTAKSTIKERDNQLEGLKQAGGDVKALQEQISQLQADNAQKDADHAAEMKQLKIERAVDGVLRDAMAINPATVKPLLADFLDKAELAEDGSIKGLADEVAKLAKAEDTSFLFKAAETSGISGASPAGSVTAGADPKAGGYQGRLNEARKNNNQLEVIKIKQEAAADGVVLM